MSRETSSPYPGELATPADQYRQAAQLLIQLGRRGKPLSRAPFRLAAIHAIELYLNALLLRSGLEPNAVRGLQHDLAKRAILAADAGLKLRMRTANHLSTLQQSREYLVARYGPELTGKVSQVNRLEATLEEVAKKVTALLSLPTVPGIPSSASGRVPAQRAA